MADALKTRLIDGLSNPKEAVFFASGLLKAGDVCAIPTETVYGLAANTFNVSAVDKIFIAKGRPRDNPLISHINDFDMLNQIAEFVPDHALELAQKFWPGPLSLILKKKKDVPDEISGGLDTAAVRMPSHKLALEIINACGFPLAAPSANISGRPSPTRAADVLNDMRGKIPLIIDGGECSVGVESTVVDVTGDIPVILRPGDISADMIKKAVGRVKIHKGIADAEKAPPSPGMKYRHYAPDARVITFIGEKNAVAKTIMAMYYLYKEQAVIICSEESKYLFGQARVIDLGYDKESAQKRLFYALRQADKTQCEAALFLYEDYMGEAVKNRITKASQDIIILED